jgi:hypothetical protein
MADSQREHCHAMHLTYPPGAVTCKRRSPRRARQNSAGVHMHSAILLRRSVASRHPPHNTPYPAVVLVRSVALQSSRAVCPMGPSPGSHALGGGHPLFLAPVP